MKRSASSVSPSPARDSLNSLDMIIDRKVEVDELRPAPTLSPSAAASSPNKKARKTLLDVKAEPASASAGPCTPPKKRSKKKTNGSTPASVDRTGAICSGAASGSWTPEKKEQIMARMIDAGYKALNLPALAAEFGLVTQQIHNQFAPSRKGCMRDRAVKAAGAGV